MFDVRRSSVSFPIRLAVFLVSGGAYMKLHSSGGARISVITDEYSHQIHERTRKIIFVSWPPITLISNYIADGLNPNLFRSLNIEICDLFEIWCLRFGIFNTLRRSKIWL